jgi:hypothetical protein
MPNFLGLPSLAVCVGIKSSEQAKPIFVVYVLGIDQRGVALWLTPFARPSIQKT